MEWSEWRQLFPGRIVRRGQDYYEEGRVTALAVRDGVIHGVVRGTQRYQVALTLRGNLIEEWCCDCPYGGDGTPCKHLAAVFFALERGEPVERQASLEALVAGLTARQAKTLLLRLARQDRAVAERLRHLAKQLPREGAEP